MATKDAVKEHAKIKIQEPKQYDVIMLNDDFTTMEFVVEILIDIFHKDAVNAEAIMMKVHKNGQAVVGRYPYDIALTKVNTAMARAEAEGFPFRLKVEHAR